MARVIRANRVELAELLAREQAKVAGLAQVEIDFTAEYLSPPSVLRSLMVRRGIGCVDGVELTPSTQGFRPTQ